MGIKTLTVIQFARLLPLYLEQPNAIRESVAELARIIDDDNTTDNERMSAAYTIEEALFPSAAIDLETMKASRT